ncbi:cysteine-rich receptor-like protein kinase 10 [Lolium perenne]|uniref:cysteine-rich receptor-like protein kinase 10 n=1 Tax=Lolium perenne TaxID=4522 RepID=UPI003A99C868
MPLPATTTGGVCGNDGNYTHNSNYQSNLAALAATLPTNASASPELFAQATAGEAPNAVHALALCRGDMVNTTACKDCIADSFQEAQQACSYSKGAVVYYDYGDDAKLSCLLGFSGDDGFLGPAASGIADNTTLFQSWNQETIIGDAGVVADVVHVLLNRTATYAATSQSRFATVVMDSVNSPIRALYSLAQCTPDLSAGDCLACLQHLVGMVNATTSVLKGGRILVLRCNIRFELFQFYNGQPLQRMSPLSIAPASPVRAPSTGKSMYNCTCMHAI